MIKSIKELRGKNLKYKWTNDKKKTKGQKHTQI